jgi:DNA-binding winged helix-turn-helix (wHTH) protein
LVEPVMPRTAVTSPTAIRMHFGSFELNVAERSLRNADEVIPLGGRAFDILLTLIERNGEVVTKDELIKKVWPEVTVEEGSLRVHLSALRKALGDGRFGNRYIVNVKGRGYSFVAPVTQIRAYALQKLAESGEYLATARRHAEHVRAIIAPPITEPVLTVDDLIRHGRELDNVRAALEWSFCPDGDVAVGVALVAAFAPVWIHLSLVGECRRRTEQVLGMVGSDLQLTRALEYRLVMALGVALTLTLGPIRQTREAIAKARQLAVGIDDTEVHLRTL